MERLAEAVRNMGKRVLSTLLRFPLTVVCLGCAAAMFCYLVSQHQGSELLLEKLLYTFLLGAFIGVTAQFKCERFPALFKMRMLMYLISILLTAGYFLIILPAAGISMEVTVRTMAAVFAMFCAFVWIPSYKGKFDFNNAALIHLKAAFTSGVYSAVLAIGCAAIIAGIDTLLIRVSDDAFAYMMIIIWILFAPVYYLSLLPRFNSEDEAEIKNTREASLYPAFLEILISYIAIPLAAVYTLVFAVYFVKILVTLNWPSGQLGGMVLAYAAAGLIIYILSSPLSNRFAVLYRRFFPWMLIPVVIMQLISVGIRLSAYGITESRYYVALFGVFSLICAVLLILKPVKRNGMIALLAALFAVFSVIPPADAFTLSRVSQINRLEKILIAEGILADGKISTRPAVSEKAKVETTNILDYLHNQKYIKYIKWLPEDFNPYEDMKGTFGFERTYPTTVAEENDQYFYIISDMQQKPLDISGFNIMIDTYSGRGDKTKEPLIFTIGGQKYQLVQERISPREVKITVNNGEGRELVSTGLYEFVKTLPLKTGQNKAAVAGDKLILDAENNGYELRVILQNVSGFLGDSEGEGIDYDLLVMFGLPD